MEVCGEKVSGCTRFAELDPKVGIVLLVPASSKTIFDTQTTAGQKCNNVYRPPRKHIVSFAERSCEILWEKTAASALHLKNTGILL